MNIVSPTLSVGLTTTGASPTHPSTAYLRHAVDSRSLRTHGRSHQGATLQSSHNQSPNRTTARLTAELRSAIMRLDATGMTGRATM